MMVRNQLVLAALRPKGWYRRLSGFVGNENHWTTGGLPSGATVNAGVNTEFKSFWSGNINLQASQLGATHCVSCARGGPALRQSAARRLTGFLGGDGRKNFTPGIFAGASSADEGRSWSREMELSFTARVGARTSFDFSAYAEQRVVDAQWVANFGATLSDTVHHTFARLDQDLLQFTARANVTLSPTLSVQLYALPFIATGNYSDWRELADPRAESYADRFTTYSASNPTGFNTKQFNSNTVVRWEYRPGSVLFFVWQQGRFDARNPGSLDAGRDLHDLFESHPNNTFLVKLSYWFNP
jgi:hypothetical protein